VGHITAPAANDDGGVRYRLVTLPGGLPELLEAALEAGTVGEVDGAAGQVDPHDQHRAVRLAEDRRADLDDAVGANGEEEPVELSVMELAKRDAVADDRLALGVALGRDVRRVQELQAAQPAEGASLGVRPRSTPRYA
jgi:hypothetical protein